LFPVSSILPPGCKIISKEEGIKLLKPGQIRSASWPEISLNEPNRLIAASVGCAILQTAKTLRILIGASSIGETDKKAGDCAEDLAAQICLQQRSACHSMPKELECLRAGIQDVRQDCQSQETQRSQPEGTRTDLDNSHCCGCFLR